MPKASFWFLALALGSGLLLSAPFPTISWFSYLKYSHIFIATLLVIMVVKIIYSHVPQELSNPFKSRVKKWNGFKYLLYLFLALSSGVLVLSGFSDSWIKNTHLGIGAWSLLVGWKHMKRRV